MASRTLLFPRKEKETLLTPPLTCAWGKFSRIQAAVLKKSTALFLCSSIPVATGKMLGSKIMSSGGKPTTSTKTSYERLQISIRRSSVSACPSSSNAIMITAAPYLRIVLACLMKFSSPSFKLIELTTDFP